MTKDRDDVVTTRYDVGCALLDTRTGRYWQLNASGALIYGCLEKGMTVERVAHVLVEEYGIDRVTAESDVRDLQQALLRAGLAPRR